MKEATITLAGKQCTIEELPRKANAKWREELEAKFGIYTQLFEEIADTELFDSGKGDSEEESTVKNESQDNLRQIVSKIASSVNSAVDDMFDLVVSYSPKLSAKELEDTAYESEIVEAFADVLTLAYPFDGLVSRIRGLIPSGR